PISVTAAPPEVHPNVAAIDPTQVRKRLHERRVARLHHRIVFVVRHEHADAPYALALLRTSRERPCRRAAEPSNELPPSHSISSARSRIDWGTARPSALAVLRFTTISYFVGNCTGRSPGFAPRRMRST